MKKNSNEMSTGAALLVTVGIMLFIGFVMNACEPKCSMAECDNKAKENSRYCYMHDMSYRNYGNPDYNAVYKNAQRNKNKTTSSGTKVYDSGSSSSTSHSNKTTTTKKKVYHTYDSYDAGYEDVYEDDDYDWDRYWSDSDYADGVDDAMDELDW